MVSKGEKLKRAQQDDPDIQLLIQKKAAIRWTGTDASCSMQLQKCVRVWDQLQVRDGVLVRVPFCQEKSDSRSQVVLPKSMVPSVC